jgi:rhamnosyltransferase
VAMNSDRPRILVLLTAFNGAKWIRAQIQSIVTQQDVNVSLVISDDGSLDETRSEIERCARGAAVSLMPPAVPSGSAAQNFLRMIRDNSPDEFDFVAYSDQDDLWDSDKLKRAVTALRDADYAGYSSAVTAVWSDGRTREIRQVSAPTASDFLFEGAGQGCTFVLTPEFYRRIRNVFATYPSLTSGLHYHDWATYALARAWGLRWYFDSRSTMRYRQHGENDTGARRGKGAIAKRMTLIRNGWYRSQVQLITQLCLSAAPSNRVVGDWARLKSESPLLTTRLRMALFCIRGGRRKRIDRVVLVVVAIAGWL